MSAENAGGESADVENKAPFCKYIDSKRRVGFKYY